MISIKQQDIINFLQQISAVAVASHIAVTNPSEDLIKSSEVVERYCNGNKNRV